MTRKRVALKHPIERAVDFCLRNLPRDQRAMGKVCREKRLPNASNGSRAQHRRDPRHYTVDVNTGATRNFLERFTYKAFDFVLRNREDLRVDRIVILDR